MLNKIKRFLGLETLQEKVERFDTILKSIQELETKIDELASEYTSKYAAYSNFKKLNVSEDISKSVETRWGSFLADYIPQIKSVKQEKGSLQKSFEDLLKVKEINQAYKEIKAYQTLKKAHKSGQISVEQYDNILKAKNGKVLYSDTIVFNEKGEILILQRAKSDQGGKKWVVAGGHVDKGETHEEAAYRELFEESGITVDSLENVGSYDDDNCHIEYFQAYVKEDEVILVLQQTEMQDSKWIGLDYLDDYEFVFNMKDNLKQILGIEDQKKTIIEKAIQDGIIDGKKITEITKSKKREKVNKVMSEFENGTLKDSNGKVITNKEQALAIAISEADLVKGFDNIIEKSRSGTYSDTPENKRLKRVGQKYGSKKADEPSEPKDNKKEETPSEPQKMTPEELTEQAKNTSVGALESAIKESSDPEVRQAAHAELQRREKEEHPQEEKEAFGEPKKEEVKPETTEKKENEETEDVLKSNKVDINRFELPEGTILYRGRPEGGNKELDIKNERGVHKNEARVFFTSTSKETSKDVYATKRTELGNEIGKVDEFKTPKKVFIADLSDQGIRKILAPYFKSLIRSNIESKMSNADFHLRWAKTKKEKDKAQKEYDKVKKEYDNFDEESNDNTDILASQYLSDFDNGVKLKNILGDLGFDGFKFKEHHGETIGFFDKNKISQNVPKKDDKPEPVQKSQENDLLKTIQQWL